MRGKWEPLLDGARRDRALEVVDAIARDLQRHVDLPATPWHLASMALLFAYRAASGHGGTSDVKTAGALLDRACDGVNDSPGEPTLYDGFAGVAWVTEHVAALLHPNEAHDWNESVDEALAELLSDWKRTFDLISGLVGIGVYALERGPRGAPCVEQVVAGLRRSARPQRVGYAWYALPEWLSPTAHDLSPGGHYDLGVAHGTAGVVSLLARARAETGVEVGDLLEGAVAWTIAHSSGGWARKWISESPSPVVHSVWCYGNLGVAAALLVAARAAERDEWERSALELAHSGERAKPEAIALPGVCHGTAGIAHVYQRLYVETGDPRCADAAREWLDATIEMRKPDGIGGYEILVASGERAGTPDTGFLTGSVGLALALLAASTAYDPLWDRLLLIAPPKGNAVRAPRIP